MRSSTSSNVRAKFDFQDALRRFMMLYLHDGKRCSFCERPFEDGQTLIQLPAEKIYCALERRFQVVTQVMIHVHCAVLSEEH